MKPKDNDFARKRGLPYREISSKANYGIRELYLEVAKTLMGCGRLAVSSAKTNVTAAMAFS